MSIHKDIHFLQLCDIIAKNESTCLSRKVGAVIVLNGELITTGVSGPPKGCKLCDKRLLHDTLAINLFKETFNRLPERNEFDGKCFRQVVKFKSGEGLEWCPSVHAEGSAFMKAARWGKSIKGATLYVNLTPCNRCFVECINAGITRLVVSNHIIYDKTVQWVMYNSKINIDVIDLQNKTIKRIHHE